MNSALEALPFTQLLSPQAGAVTGARREVPQEPLIARYQWGRRWLRCRICIFSQYEVADYLNLNIVYMISHFRGRIMKADPN